VKHYSPQSLQRLVIPNLRTEDQMVAELRERLAASTDRHGLACELGVTPFRLAGILRGRWPIDDSLAEKLGYRRVTRFERLSGT
jgi:hypothetical protein